MDHRSRTTRRTALFADTSGGRLSPEHPTLLISPLSSLSPHTAVPFSLALVPWLVLAILRFLLPRRFVLSSAADVQITPKYHRRIIAAAVLSISAGSRPFRSRGRRDLSVLTIAHCIVSPIGELNGEAESLTSRAPFGQIRPDAGNRVGKRDSARRFGEASLLL